MSNKDQPSRAADLIDWIIYAICLLGIAFSLIVYFIELQCGELLVACATIGGLARVRLLLRAILHKN